MLEALLKWNRWGDNPLNSGIPRKITPKIFSYCKGKEIIALIGPRRSGKSTVLYQIMDNLHKEGVPEAAMLHINFEEPKLQHYLTLEGLDQLYDCYRENIFPEGKVYLFLDEIQNILEWEKWVRARSETENVKIFVSGSSAKLMSREIATLLTGRHFSFEITPLDFSEFLNFSEIPQPKHRLQVAPPPNIKHALNSYLKWGGFPAVVLSKTDAIKEKILAEYFTDILFKDIVLRHDIRDAGLLKNLAIHLLSQTGKLLSFQRIANTFQISSETAIEYSRYIKEAFIVELVSYYSLKASIRNRHPHKIHAVDLGLRNCVSLSSSDDEGRIIESLVYNNLRKRYGGENIYYWSGKNEIDFVIKDKNTIVELWQVVSGDLDDKDLLDRELQGFHEAATVFPKAKPILVTKTLPKKTSTISSQFKGTIIALWQLILD